MKIHRLDQEQLISAPLDDVFPFFARPENLGKLTPAFLGFQLLTPSPIPMHVGALIDYVVSVNGVPMRWTTGISEYDPPHRFVDVQLRGPYSFWHHTHTFERLGEETRIRDTVRYAMPFGPLGALAHALMVKRQLTEIFAFRRRFLEQVEDWSAVSASQ